MKGIDVYRGESTDGKSSKLKAVPEKAYKQSDFVIVKSTQGISYGHTKFFHNMIKRAKKDGKLIGAYHYASGHDAVKEADYFLSVVKPYLGEILLCLDWESYQNKAWGSKTWAKKFVDRVKEKTGLTCVLYTGLDGCNQCVNLAGKVPLWFAGYPNPKYSGWKVPTFKYNLGKWKTYDIWQYTSSNEQVDRNTTKWTELEWRKYASGKAIPEILIEQLKKYNKYIKAHPNKFYNKYVNTITTFAKAKKLVKKGKKVGITCVVPLRWALANMGIKNGKGMSLISAPNGSFKSYYNGDVKKYLKRITKGKVIGKTFKKAVDKGLLKKGDIVCFKDLTHTSVYSGNKYKAFEGGKACTVNGHYPKGIMQNYAKKYKNRKIAEVLRWKDQPETKDNTETKKETTTTNVNPTTSNTITATTSKGEKYTGAYPILPPRGYFKIGDGITGYENYKPNIKALQNLLNWILGTKLTIDGKYGINTENAVKKLQRKFKVDADGKFGIKSLKKCKEYSK